jgi:hypothetical protein
VIALALVLASGAWAGPTYFGTTANSVDTTQALTDAASIAWDVGLGPIGTVTITANRAVANPTNLVTGGVYTLIVTQDGTGGRTLTWGSTFASAPTLRTSVSAVSALSWIYDGSKLRQLGGPRTKHVPYYSRIGGMTAANGQLTTAPAAAYTTTTFVVGADFGGCVEYRMVARNSSGVGPAGGKLALEGSADGGSTWTHLNGDATGSFGGSTPYIVLETTGNYATTWTALASALQAEIALRQVTAGGDGASKPAIDNFRVECR